MPGPTTLSNAEIDIYSVRLAIQSGLNAAGWTQPHVKLMQNGWPTAMQIQPNDIFVTFADSTVTGVELGSNGKSRELFVYIFGKTPAFRDRLAEEITNLIRDDGLSIFAFVDGTEATPAVVDHMTADDVRWRTVPMPSSAPEIERYRSVVIATLRRIE